MRVLPPGPAALLLAAVLALALPAAGVVVHPNTGLGTPDPESPPPAPQDPGWEHLGFYGNTGAIYLGQNALGEAWILTARHTGDQGSVELDGVVYATDASASFTNPDDSNADLRAWRLVGQPPLPPLRDIIDTPPAPGEPATLLVRGRVEEGPELCWSAAWTEIACLIATYSGYSYQGQPRVKRWATNEVSLSGAAAQNLADGLGIDEVVFATDFDDGGTVLESQSTQGDSGGGLFVHDGEGFVLAGIATFIVEDAPTGGRPDDVAVLDLDQTLYTDLSYYRPQILAETGVVLPEPAGGLAAGAALLLALARTRRDTSRRDGDRSAGARTGR